MTFLLPLPLSLLKFPNVRFHTSSTCSGSLFVNFVFILSILTGSMKPQPPVTNDITGTDEGRENQTKND